MTKKYALRESPPQLSGKIHYEKELNPSQWAVVAGADGPCLVLAGAGSGKTRTLIYRVAYLLEKGVRPDEILLVTFTNKASQEMKNRVELLLQTQARGLWCGTFHHIGNRLLRKYGRLIGINEDFGILDEEDSRDLVKACIRSLELPGHDAKFPRPAVVHSILSFAVNAKTSVADVVVKRYPYFGLFIKYFEKIRARYEDKKVKTRNLDYDDLLVRWIELLQKSEEAREKLTRQFRYCLVDEYQDTNRLQQDLVELLSGYHRNLLVVGDDAQSIYSFRAAEIRNILEFPERHDPMKIFKLETNYRSTGAVLNLANHSIRHNIRQFPKTLKSVHEQGDPPEFVRVRDTRQEAHFVAQRILDFHRSGVELSQIAVLFRARYQAAELELELAKRGLPYLIRGGVRFFEQAHIKDALCFLRILMNPLDELAWERALTLQPGIGGGFAGKIFNLVEKARGHLPEIVSTGFAQELSGRVREGFGRFRQILKALLAENLQDRPDLLIEQVLEKGYDKYVLMNFENAEDRLEDLKELVNFAHTYKNLKEFLADVTLRENFRGETLLENGPQAQRVPELILSTIHQAKGLEWRVVFIIRLSEGQFPHAKSVENESELEEERRLFYVAATRAKKNLILVHALTRYDYNEGTVINRPSIFISELPPDAYEEVEVEEPEEETIYLE